MNCATKYYYLIYVKSRGSMEEFLCIGRLLLLVYMSREAEQGDRWRDGREEHGA
jgi:hypothetical protein